MNRYVKEANKSDKETVYSIEELAFGETDEAILVEKLVADSTAEPNMSLLAYEGQQAIGHILFTKGSIVGAEEQLSVMILGPLAVLPDYQKQGIGGLLVQEGLSRLERMGVDLVFVLGHIEYYPRHGFRPALPQGFQPPYPTKKGLEDAWMVLDLSKKQKAVDCRGKVRCSDAFMLPEYW
ncbi:GNAT family N-acetyltransferase [Enterococcus sp. BWR-S5]|uniref:GNAT family N-acetyltransferase n=1 Tax=Enterococcus sp. BWR-S5 TaxID=2787714 RepID=UPI0019246B42|nr:N-acetyltransferase [Enterococcus sp. BWR-S5]MBL1226161.1 N-acetyltransferase [Enterococcus sp. BWR-S5]